MTTIGIVAGEASGDALGATLIAAVRERLPHVRFAGIAGPKMAAAGCEVWVPSEALAVRGLVEVVRHLPRLVGIRRALASRLCAERVPLFVGIDAPDFNLGLEWECRRRRGYRPARGSPGRGDAGCRARGRCPFGRYR